MSELEYIGTEYVGTPGADGAGTSFRGGSGEPLLCVHGITDSWRTWELVAPHLTPHHEMIALSLYGHREGRIPDAATRLENLVDEAERDIDAAGLERSHILANSLGGWIALELAARGRAKSLVLLSPAGGWEGRPPAALRTYKGFRRSQWMMRNHLPRALKMIKRPRTRKFALRDVVADGSKIPVQTAAWMLQSAAECPAAGPLLDQADVDGWPNLEPIDVPIRIAWGSEDRIIPKRHLSSRFHEFIPDAEWIDLEGIGHMPQIECPQETAKLTLEITKPGAAITIPETVTATTIA